MEIFTGPPESHILLLLFQISILLLVARACGEVAQRIGQPAVVGELLAGIILGPSFLGYFFPFFSQWVVPQTLLQSHFLEIISLISAIFLLLITGLETDLRLIKRYLKTGLSVSFCALTLLFISGYLLGYYLPDQLLAQPDKRNVFALYIATAMSISSIPVIAKVLLDMKMIRSEIGQTIIAAGMSDDTIGWILLSVVTGLASGAGFSVFGVTKALGFVFVFLLFSFTIGRFIIRKIFFSVQTQLVSSNKALSVVLLMTFMWATLSQALHLEAVFGAFVIGIIFGQVRQLPADVFDKLESMTIGFFAPIFFAIAGLKVDLTHLTDPTLLFVTFAVIIVASAGKIVGAFIGARYIGRKDNWTALSFGVGMNARGAMGIIMATIGLQIGIINQDMFSVIVIMSIVTSIMSPLMLRWSLQHTRPNIKEIEHIEEQQRIKESLVEGIRRILLPIRYKKESHLTLHTLEAKILDHLGAKTKLNITLFSVAYPGEKQKHIDYLNRLVPFFPKHNVSVKVMESHQLADVILDEAHRSYDLLVLGAPERNRSTDILFTPLVDYLMRVAPCSTLIVKSHNFTPKWQPDKILVPTNGSNSSKLAAEFSFKMAANHSQVTLLHAIVQDSNSWRYKNESEMLQRELGISKQILEELEKLGSKMKAITEPVSRIGPNPETVILNYAEQNEIDLIVLGTSLRPGSERLFLGPRVERILNNAKCPVVVFNTQ